MARNKVVYDGETLIDLTEDTVTPSTLKKGITAHDKSGATIVGELETEYNWEPHDGMPDLSTLDLSPYKNIAFFTFDASKSNIWLGFTVASATKVDLEVSIGTVVDGEFVTEQTLTGYKTATTYKQPFPETNLDYPVLRLYCPTQDVRAFQPQATPNDFYASNVALTAYDNYIVDARIKGTTLTTITSSKPITYYMEHMSLENLSNKITTLSSFGQYGVRMRQIDFVDCDFSNVTTMYRAFYCMYSLKRITGYENWNTSKVTAMNGMFYQCPEIEKLDLHGWDVSLVKTFDTMFNNCKKLKYLDISTWNTASATTLNQMFGDCSSLEELDLRHFNVSNCTIFSKLFYNMLSLKKLDVSGWDVSKGTTFASVCYSLYEIPSVDLSTWTLPTLSSQTMMTTMLYNLFAVSEIRIPQGIEYALSLSYTMLSEDSLAQIAEALGTANGAQTITFGTAKNKLTDEQKATITSKGWTIA